MNNDVTEWIWLNEHDTCPATYLIEVSGLTREEFDELLLIGIIEPVDQSASTQLFPLRYLTIAHTARRLRDDFELDVHGVALAMRLMQRIDMLQSELMAARARVPTHGL